ncbi:Lipase 2 [Frondihabitans sp. 762G35]|uniref:SGNH/GDSL hydrolase family protein n=1 Tax=Frondihabitans sp. 762G35 TaxID=1446794 RepID=UPI000D22C12C|nr:SGNH/GDSL hydrolase family protein [Frondihabitans sp. 762G35]ARC58020.1 Lipase 2 [Frondihabitans sp. 762G35]
MPSPLLVAALGSSFAAGPGIEPVADAAALRSERNYAHQLAARLGADLVDLTVSGATTSNILDTPQQSPNGATFPPQLDGLPADTDVVTMTAGGNDLRFAGALLHLSWLRVEPDSPLVPMLGEPFADGIPPATDDVVESATTGLVRVVEAVRRKAPNARVLLVDYLTVLDRDSLPHLPFTADEFEVLLVIQSAIGRVFREAASQTGADLVLASTLSAGHALGSSDPWVQPFHRDPAATAGSFHPTEAGMSAIAVELERVLRA